VIGTASGGDKKVVAFLDSGDYVAAAQTLMAAGDQGPMMAESAPGGAVVRSGAIEQG
jgi:hypothetical protein